MNTCYSVEFSANQDVSQLMVRVFFVINISKNESLALPVDSDVQFFLC